jgi:hypothetical protein
VMPVSQYRGPAGEVACSQGSGLRILGCFTALLILHGSLAGSDALPACCTCLAVSHSGSQHEDGLYLDVLLERDGTQLPALLLVGTGCHLPLRISEYMADRLGLAPDGFSAALDIGQGHRGRVTRRCASRCPLMSLFQWCCLGRASPAHGVE